METANVEERPRKIPIHGEHEMEGRVRGLLAGGTIAEAGGGGGALVLGILGLIGLLPLTLAAVATILVGAGLTLGGGTLAGRYARLLSRSVEDPAADAVATGMAFESICGVAGIALGVLAVLGISPLTLLAVATIVLGAAATLGSSAAARLDNLLLQNRQRLDLPSPAALRLSYDAVQVGSSAEVMVGLAAIVLGIVALSGTAPLTMILVAQLSLGLSVLLSGTALASRIFTVLR